MPVRVVGTTWRPDKSRSCFKKLWMSFGALDYDTPLDPDDYVTTKFADAVKVDK